MNNSKERYLPVFDDNGFVGIITIHDLMREAMTDYEKGKADLASHEKEFLATHGR
jgi:CBS domain-containing protein